MKRRKRWRFFHRTELVGLDGTPYLTRWHIIDTPFGGIMLHRFHGPDPGRHLHDHPWSFLSIVLRGGYLEENFTWPVYVKRWSYHRAEDAHRVARLFRTPTWTLIIRGRRRRQWGFFLAEALTIRWVHWETYCGVDQVDSSASARASRNDCAASPEEEWAEGDA